MKKITLALAILASTLVLASCASKGTTEQTPAPEATTAGHHHHGHHDYKGETN